MTLYPPGRAYVILLLKLVKLPLLDFVLFGKASNDLANLAKEEGRGL